MTAFRITLPILSLLASVWSQAEESVDFVRDIRPIVSENCAFCHGPDEASREADLRLDTADGLESVVGGRGRDQSEFFRRIISDDESERMPPPDSNRALTPEQIELIGRWIDDGGKWDQHWSFSSIERPTPAQLPAGWNYPNHGAIDSFVQSELARRKMQPATAAPRETMIRRLSLDLTGLPPTIEQIRQFVDDEKPGAYGRLVDRLLDSPAYGQRMAWDWLDAARYADSNGYQQDRDRTMWPWRDWVVDAFNRNVPYDEFTIWQLAGDQLPNATEEQRLATGFCRNHMINGEGGRIPEENRVEYVMDMTETMGTVWLGLTLNCCRCHDHKYDPISNQEYYQLFSFFNQTPVKGNGGDPQTPPVLTVPSKEQTASLASIAQRLKAVDKELVTLAKALQLRQTKWGIRRISSAGDSNTLAPLAFQQSLRKWREPSNTR